MRRNSRTAMFLRLLSSQSLEHLQLPVFNCNHVLLGLPKHGDERFV